MPEPEDDWTWNTMVGHAATLTRDANGRQIRPGDPDSGGATAAVYGLGVEPSIIRVAPFVWSNGGELVDDDAKPTRFTLDTPKAQEALRGFLDLRLAYGVIPSDVEVEAQDDETRFANGGLAMLLSSRRSTPLFRTITEFDWDVAPLPRWTERAGILHSDAFCITSASERKNTAWGFVEYALGPEGQVTLAESGRTVPSLIEVSQSEAFLDPSKPPKRARVFLDGIPSIRVLPVISTWPEIEDATGPILENGLYLGQPASTRSPSGSTASRARCSRAGRRPERSPSRGSHKALRRRRGARPARPRGRPRASCSRCVGPSGCGQDDAPPRRSPGSRSRLPGGSFSARAT